MSGTFASLIRQYQLHPKTTHAAPESDRVSAPGRYDKTGSQKSTYLERLVEQEQARKEGEDLGFDPEDLEDVGGFDDLQDLIDDKNTDPTGGDPGENPVDPLDPDLPDPDEPGGEPDVTPPPPIERLRVYLLHNSSISYSNDGGAHWRNVSGVPESPLGFAVTSQGIYVATDDGVHYSTNLLDGWTELAVPSTSRPISSFINGSFESGLAGWDHMSGIEPRATWFDHIAPTDGENYLTRDWLFFTNSGAFEIAQEVTLAPSELSAVGLRTLSFSADVFCEGGSVELRIERNVNNMPFFRSNDRILGNFSDSGPLSECEISSTGLSTSTVSAAISFWHEIDTAGAGWDSRFLFRVRLTRSDGSSAIFQHPMEIEDNRPSKADLRDIRDGVFVRAFTLTLKSVIVGGTITLKIPAGWRYPIDAINASGERVSISDVSSNSIGFGSGWVEIVSASGSDYGWHRISADAYSLPSSSIRCVIEATGNPADVYIDNARLELLELPIGVTVTAISRGDDGAAYAAVNGYVHKLSPIGMTRIENGWTISPTGLNGASLGWQGSTIATGGEEISAPGSVRDAFSAAGKLTVITESGEVYHRVGGEWDDPFGGPVEGQLCYEPMRGIYILISNEGSLSVSRDGGGWETGPTLPGGYHGEFGTCTVGRRVFLYTRGGTPVWWLDSNSLRLGGAAPAGILDISGR